MVVKVEHLDTYCAAGWTFAAGQRPFPYSTDGYRVTIWREVPEVRE